MKNYKDFFGLFLTLTQHDYELRALPSKDRIFTRDLNLIEKFIKSHQNEHCYFGVYTRKGGGKGENIQEATCLFADLDFKNYKKGQKEAETTLSAFPLAPSITVYSGNGIHAYWLLEEPIQNAFEKESALKNTLKGIALKINSDIAVADIARILRIPNTFNHKCVPAKEVLISSWTDKRYTLKDFEPFVVQEVDSQYPVVPYSVPLITVIEKCKFIQYCSENRDTLPEPLWYAMVSNVARLVNGPSLCHELSKGYHRYNPRETDQKILHALNASAPMTCLTIKELMQGYLGNDCGMKCEYKSPAGMITGYKTKQDKIQIVTHTMKDIMKSTVEFVDNRYMHKNQLSGITTGFDKFDDVLDGFQPGNLIILASRPSVGKSALLLNMAQAASKVCPVGIISLEMTGIEKGIRLLAANTNILIQQFRKGRLNREEMNNYTYAAGQLSELPIFFQYGIYTDVAMTEAIEILTKGYGCRLVFIDHLHLMRTAKIQQNKNVELSVITASAKTLAQKFNIPIVLLCQMNRAVEQEKREPRLADLRESGAIEQDADIVIFLHVDDKKTGSSVRTISAIIAKGRNVGYGRVKMTFIGGITKFIEQTEKGKTEEEDVL